MICIRCSVDVVDALNDLSNLHGLPENGPTTASHCALKGCARGSARWVSRLPSSHQDRRKAASFLVAARTARGFRALGRVIECGLLSGLHVRRFQKPRAGMVISGSGPNLLRELCCSSGSTGFPDPDLFDRAPIQVIGFSHSPLAPELAGHGTVVMPAPAPDPDNLRSSSASPRSAGPSCWPARSRPAFSASLQACARSRSRSAPCGARGPQAASSRR